jgi:NAD(P)-dependent dehydrogenase (short-subunit alcohol dehydrogenase family)
VCVFNAAIRRLAPIGELGADDWLESVATNLTAPFLLTKATLPAVRRARGLYVFMGSHAATRFFEGGAAYCGTKAGLKALVEILLLEERTAGVRAVLVSPGAIANRPDDFSPTKISPESLGSMVTDLILRTPEDIVVGEIELRPAVLKEPPVAGMSRLQSV